MKIYPVIHHATKELSLENAELALECGADGVFVISMQHEDIESLEAAVAIKKAFPTFRVGINMLSKQDAFYALEASVEAGLDMTWTDYPSCLVESHEIIRDYLRKANWNRSHHEFFAPVAFKYQRYDPNPTKTAMEAYSSGFIPTTSGSATGSAADIDKVITIKTYLDNHTLINLDAPELALASGLSPDNISKYAPYITHALVNTAISKDFHTFDKELLTKFVTRARR